MFPRSERFVEKIEITPGPNHYDVKAGEEDPYKRFGFLGKTKRFNESNHNLGPNGLPFGPTGSGGLYERNSLSVSLPSLVIDNDDTASLDTASVHSNGSATPDYTTARTGARRPTVTARSKSSDKLGLAFTANSNKVEERLKKELSDLTEKFEKYRIARQRDLDMMSEKQKKAEAMYQGAIKDKNSIQTHLVAKENEIAELGARHNILKASLEKSEKAAASISEKIGKGVLLQKRIDELERVLSRAKASLDEQESIATEVRQKFDLERQQFQQQIAEQQEHADLQAEHVQDKQREAEQRHEDEMRKVKEDSESWRIRFEELERLFKELERKLEAEQRTVAELREMMKREREQLQDQIEKAQETIQRMEQERAEADSTSRETTNCLRGEKETLDRLLQSSRSDFEDLSTRHHATEQKLEEQRVRYSEVVDTMTRQNEEQQVHFAKEQQEHMKARQDLERSIEHLIMELGQNRGALLNVQKERAHLQDKYDHSQSELQNATTAMMALEKQHQQLQETARQEQEGWAAKYEALSEQSTTQKQAFDTRITELNATLEKKNDDYTRIMKSVDTIQIELREVESQREEVIAAKAEEERKAVEALSRLAKLEQEHLSVTQQLSSLDQDSKALKLEWDELKDEAHVKELSIKSLETEVELITSKTKERETHDKNRIKELEDMQMTAAKDAMIAQEKEQAWEMERVRMNERADGQLQRIEVLQSQLDETNIEREAESCTSVERIKELEARCCAMESAFEEMFEKSGSSQEIERNQPRETWTLHSAAVLNVLTYHTSECSISKVEHAALLEEKNAAEESSAALSATLQEQETVFKKSQADHSGLLAKIAELEDQIRHLTAQVEFLEAENIGKVAIIKALQDEYDYQEKVIRDLSKNDDAAAEVMRLEDQLRRMAARTQETEEWIKEVQADNEKYRGAYVKADVAREETLLDMAKLHEELAESEQARIQVENQMQVEVNAMIKKYELSGDELSRLSKMNIDSAQNLNLKQKVKQVAQLKEENLALKKKNLGLLNTRDSLRLKCLQIERDLESYKAANPCGAIATSASVNSSSNRPCRAGSVSGASSVVSSSSGVLAGATLVTTDQFPSGKLQLQGLIPVTTTTTRSRSTSPGSMTASNGAPMTKESAKAPNRPPLRSRAARSFMAGHSTTS